MSRQTIEACETVRTCMSDTRESRSGHPVIREFDPLTRESVSRTFQLFFASDLQMLPRLDLSIKCSDLAGFQLTNCLEADTRGRCRDAEECPEPDHCAKVDLFNSPRSQKASDCLFGRQELGGEVVRFHFGWRATPLFRTDVAALVYNRRVAENEVAILVGESEATTYWLVGAVDEDEASASLAADGTGYAVRQRHHRDRDSLDVLDQLQNVREGRVEADPQMDAGELSLLDGVGLVGTTSHRLRDKCFEPKIAVDQRRAEFDRLGDSGVIIAGAHRERWRLIL